MRRLTGSVQHYAWGTVDAIPQLLHLPPDGMPWAELWFGSHAGGPTFVDDTPVNLAELLRTEGRAPLPFLLKVLSAAEPLSIQVHPDRLQAAAGFERENAAGVPIDSPTRTYKDANHKPEILCALSEFWALCGFRPIAQTLDLVRALALDAAHAASFTALEDDPTPTGLEALMAALFALPASTAGSLATAIAQNAVALPDRFAAERRWLPRIGALYPGDIGIAAAALLNTIRVAPGEAIYLGAGNVHAYLHGTGIELMAASDNVVRGGLTPKHVDSTELLAIIDTNPLVDPVIQPVLDADGWLVYPVPVTDFVLRRASVATHISMRATSAEIVLCTEGAFDSVIAGQARLAEPGEHVVFTGAGTLFRASSGGGAQ